MGWKDFTVEAQRGAGKTLQVGFLLPQADEKSQSILGGESCLIKGLEAVKLVVFSSLIMSTNLV